VSYHIRCSFFSVFFSGNLSCKGTITEAGSEPSTRPKPPPAPKKASLDHGKEAAPSDGSGRDDSGVIYAMPQKRTPSSSVPSRSTSVKKNPSPPRSMQDSHAYAEVEFAPNLASTKPSAKTSEYEYADPDACNKWSLQPIARGLVGTSDYAEIPCLEGAYATLDDVKGAVTAFCDVCFVGCVLCFSVVKMCNKLLRSCPSCTRMNSSINGRVAFFLSGGCTAVVR
jgi:hypothetical protein